MSEKLQAKRLDAKQQKNSGRGPVRKGDMVKGHFLIDVKETTNSFGLSRQVWYKIRSDAWQAGNLQPALNVSLDNGKDNIRLVVFEEDMAKELMELWNDTYG